MIFNSSKKEIDLENIYKGSSIFLILGGPSFIPEVIEQPKRFKMLCDPGIITMGVNNSSKIFRPNLWVCGDYPSRFLKSVFMDPKIMKFTHERNFDKKLLNSKIRACDCPNIYFLKVFYNFEIETYLDEKGFSFGQCQNNGGRRSTMMLVIKLLYYLGFKYVYLLGCDFHMEAEKMYSFEEHSSENHAQANNRLYNTLGIRFKLLKNEFKKHDFHVYNCTEDTQLDAFEKLSFEDAYIQALKDFPDVENESTLNLYKIKKTSDQSGSS
jgi:hypothetical protein